MGKSSSFLPSFEVIFIMVFFAFFLMWMVPRCMATKTELQKGTETVQAKIDSLDRVMDSLIVKPKSVAPDSVKSTPQIVSPTTAAGTSSASTTSAKKTTTTSVAPKDLPGKLYITIDNLKLRKSPSLDSVVVATLPLFEEVYFLNEVTEFTQEISLGYEIADEPWVKIRTRKGLDGWVYGAGVHYYKKKRNGVME